MQFATSKPLGSGHGRRRGGGGRYSSEELSLVIPTVGTASASAASKASAAIPSASAIPASGAVPAPAAGAASPIPPTSGK